ncbi:NAD(P)-dependent oxidoreductase [Guyparkeria hydrothermalis]|uniref:NAD(P)-dependent oxidoreductase n=1 Tax=Guyparkeria hydrothermalis TaxID=923 RepID=UPI00202087E0|nr:NAD(P)-dependent oxidoreductase [Guyparkeria hydrothermalis]MCL7744976.1 NAD(P)-dependent oxidoreductase [Guyparkeria hydrothermalis]
MNTTIGVIGLGLMGSAMARRLAESGLSVIGYNRHPRDVEGVTTVATLAETAEQANTLWLMVSDFQACREVIDSLGEGGIRDHVVINSSTIAPAESAELARRVEALGGEFLEAPVLGSIPQAKTGTLQLLLGGPAELVGRLEKPLEALGTPTHFGPIRSGAGAKLAFNQLIGSLTAAFSMSLGLVQREGVDVDKFMATLRESALYAPTFDKKLDNMLDHSFEKANFPLKHLLKDIRLFTSSAGTQGIDTHLLIGLQHVLEEGVYAGHGNHDYSALFESVVRENTPGNTTTH